MFLALNYIKFEYVYHLSKRSSFFDSRSLVQDMLLIEKSLVLTLSVAFLVSINTNYTVYHVYMSKKKEHNTRLLNKLYSQMAIWAQLGSVVNLLLVLQNLDIWHMPYLNTLKYLQLPCVVFRCSFNHLKLKCSLL